MLKKLVVALSVAAIGLSALPFSAPVQAQTKGNGLPPGAKREFSFNLIGTPKDYEGGCGSGHRIFVERGISGAQILVHNSGQWEIASCDATGGDRAQLNGDTDPGTYSLYVRILGKPGGRLTVCADFVSDAGDQLCLLDSFTLNRPADSKFQVRPGAIFDARTEDILWTLETNTNFRIAQFVIVRQPSPL